MDGSHTLRALGQARALQPDIGASPSELTFGKNVWIPGQHLHDPGAPPTELELQRILHNVRNSTNKSEMQPSRHNKPEPPLPGIPLDVTHVYTRQHKAQGLQVPYEGPFPIVERPSWSTVKIDVGAFKSGERRYEIQHRNDIKVAHPKSLAAPAQRPTLGRPPQVQTSAQSDPSTSTDAQAETSLPFQKPSNQFLEPPLHQQAPGSKQTTAKSDGKSRHVNHATSTRQNRLSSPDPPGIPPFITTRPVRSTRNPDPIYVDGIQWSSLRPWSASKTEISALNSLINKSN